MENDSSKHLEYFKVENFKGLESLELKDIKQFNLILGDNNVGKTSVLEALLFDELPFRLLKNLLNVFFAKSNVTNYYTDLNYLDFYFNKSSQNQSINYLFKLYGKEIQEINIKLVENYTIQQEEVDNLTSNTLVELNQLPRNIVQFRTFGESKNFTMDFTLHRNKDLVKYFPFVKTGLIYSNDIVDFYSRTVSNNIILKKEFIENLHIISDEIYDLTIDTTTIPDNPILVVLFNNGQSIPLFMMGDGTIRLVRLILEIILCKGQRLMIDEIDNGMHFSRMKEVWRVLLKVANKNNTQLFITTHDAECLKTFKEVLETEELSHLQNDVASYTLKKNENETKAVQFNFKEFENAIDYSLNLRG